MLLTSQSDNDLLFDRPFTDADQSFKIFELACKVGEDKLQDASKVQAARYKSFVERPFDYMPVLGAKGCQILVSLHHVVNGSLMMYPV